MAQNRVRVAITAGGHAGLQAARLREKDFSRMDRSPFRPSEPGSRSTP